jgi:hypothetical protein
MNVTLAMDAPIRAAKALRPGASERRMTPDAMGTCILLTSTVFDTDRDKVTTVIDNDLVGDMGPSPCSTGVSLRVALTGTQPSRYREGLGAFDGVQT